jgi:hypothetical protein
MRWQYQPGDELGGFVVEGRRDVAVDVEGDGDVRVPEALLHQPRMYPLLQGEGRPGVPQTVEREPRKSIAPGTAEERGADGVRVEAGSVRVVEDEVVVREAGTDEQRR